MTCLLQMKRNTENSCYKQTLGQFIQNRSFQTEYGLLEMFTNRKLGINKLETKSTKTKLFNKSLPSFVQI